MAQQTAYWFIREKKNGWL